MMKKISTFDLIKKFVDFEKSGVNLDADSRDEFSNTTKIFANIIDSNSNSRVFVTCAHPSPYGVALLSMYMQLYAVDIKESRINLFGIKKAEKHLGEAMKITSNDMMEKYGIGKTNIEKFVRYTIATIPYIYAPKEIHKKGYEASIEWFKNEASQDDKDFIEAVIMSTCLPVIDVSRVAKNILMKYYRPNDIVWQDIVDKLSVYIIPNFDMDLTCGAQYFTRFGIPNDLVKDGDDEYAVDLNNEKSVNQIDAYRWVKKYIVTLMDIDKVFNSKKDRLGLKEGKMIDSIEKQDEEKKSND